MLESSSADEKCRDRRFYYAQRAGEEFVAASRADNLDALLQHRALALFYAGKLRLLSQKASD
ncbi:MAG: hypothetical protein M3Q15_01840 [Pseudomonadota bacterium]|nr:hypothetical protein [Pseudomonadota bacterium]